MDQSLARRLNPCVVEAPLSPIRRVAELAARFPDVVKLDVGEPDFDTPEHIKEAAAAALREGFTHYTHRAGIIELRRAIADKLARDNGVSYDPETEITATSGIMGGLFCSFCALVSPGDEVIVPDPVWPAFLGIIHMLGGTPVPVLTHEADGFNLVPEAVAEKITPRTKLVLLNSPQNPTGAVMPRERLEAIAELAKRHDLVVLSDETYEKLIYDGAQHISIASFDGMRERTLLLNGLSKTYAMTGWRVGYVAAPKQMMEAIGKVHLYTCTCVNSIAQKAAAAALTGPQGCVEEMRQEYRARRDLLVNGLNGLPGFTCATPRGTFYAFANIQGLGMPSEDAVMRLIEKARVSSVHGSAWKSVV